LKQSTVSSVIGAGAPEDESRWRAKPSTQLAAGGENADGRLATLATGCPRSVYCRTSYGGNDYSVPENSPV
jgi:hypothetical protein